MDKRTAWPKFDLPSAAHLQQISRLRNIGMAGLRLGVERGLLFIADYRDAPCWIVTDSSRRLAQARRMDGRLLTLKDGSESKALTLPGSIASLPLGTPEAEQFANLLLVEGGPDLLAGLHFLVCECRQRDATVVCMLGASQRIAESAVPAFHGKTVRIFPHIDSSQAGRIGAAHWVRAIKPVARKVDGFDFTDFHRVDGAPVKDLNDLCLIDPDEFEQHRLLWSICPG
ncbi:MAG: hypothetical protein U1G07_08945 [Verrucomicrobiota bacterium]